MQANMLANLINTKTCPEDDVVVTDQNGNIYQIQDIVVNPNFEQGESAIHLTVIAGE